MIGACLPTPLKGLPSSFRIVSLAFTFHRTAFKERLDTVATATKVLDHLKDYKPKRRTPGGSGTQTPLMRSGLFGSLGNMMAAEPSSMEEGSTPRRDGYGADTERRSDSPARMTPPKKRGLFTFGGKTDTAESRGRRPRRQDSGIPLQDSPTHSHAYPPQTGSGSPGSGRQTPGNPRQSHEPDHEAVLIQAAKALRNVALHDARGLRGETGSEDAPGLGWSLNSAHEAKVSETANCQLP